MSNKKFILKKETVCNRRFYWLITHTPRGCCCCCCFFLILDENKSGTALGVWPASFCCILFHACCMLLPSMLVFMHILLVSSFSPMLLLGFFWLCNSKITDAIFLVVFSHFTQCLGLRCTSFFVCFIVLFLCFRLKYIFAVLPNFLQW